MKAFLSKRLAAFLTLACAFILCTLTAAYAADAEMTLEAGRTYEFVNSGEDFIYIRGESETAPPPEFDYVYKDENGIVESFGTSTGNFMVSAGGRTVVTVSGGLTVTYPEENIRVSGISGSALYTYALAAGKSAEIANGNPLIGYTLSTKSVGGSSGPRFDYVYRDESGGVSGYDSEEAASGVSLSEGGGALITAVDGMSIYMPGEWASDVTFTASESPALAYRTVSAGSTLEISNSSADSSYNLLNNASGAPYSPIYDYVGRDGGGSAVEYASGERSGELWVAAGGSTAVTVKNTYNLELWLPNEWTDDIGFAESDTDALFYYTLQPRKTVSVTNNDVTNAYTVSNNSTDASNAPKYDCVFTDGGGQVTGYDSEDRYESFDVAADGKALITSRNNYALKLWLPSEWAVKLSFTEQEAPSLSHYTLAAGKTLSIASTDENNAYDISVSSGAAGLKYDFVYKDASGSVTEYGADSLAESFAVSGGGETIITGGTALKLWLPNQWSARLKLTETADSALYKRTLGPNKTLELTNSDEYSAFDVATNSAEEARAPKYDYVDRDTEGFVKGFGAELNGSFAVRERGTTAVTAAGGYALKVWFPYEWLNAPLKVSDGEGPVMRYYRLGAGKTLELVNNSHYACDVLTNSGATPQTPELDYVLRDLSGKITQYVHAGNHTGVPLASRSKASVTAGTGYELKLYVPEEWLRSGGLTVSEASAPSVYYRTVNAGTGVKITNKNQDALLGISTNSVEEEAASPRFDYVYKDAGGAVADYGAEAASPVVSVEPGGTSLLTANRGAALELWMPYEWYGSQLEITDMGSSVYSYTVESGESVELVNSNEAYTCVVKTNGDPAPDSPKYEHVLWDADKAMAEYGGTVLNEAAASFIVIGGGRTVITAPKGGDLKLWFPHEWSLDRLKLTPVTKPALYHLTVGPGEEIEFINPTEKAFNVANNSGEAISEPKYEYSYKPTASVPWVTEEVTGGVIAVRPGAHTKIKASNGYDLKLWLPYEWLESIEVNQQ